MKCLSEKEEEKKSPGNIPDLREDGTQSSFPRQRGSFSGRELLSCAPFLEFIVHINSKLTPSPTKEKKGRINSH